MSDTAIAAMNNTPDGLPLADQWIGQAIASGANVDTLSKFLDMKERMDAMAARDAYFAAMRDVQAEARPVVKDAQNTQTGSSYARLESIAKALKPVYTAHGFSLSFDQPDGAPDGFMRVAVHVMHTGGHSERHKLDLPLDDIGIKGARNKTGIHAAGSTVSYARRYLTLMVFDIVMAGEDDDGQAADNSVERLDRLIASCAVARDWLPSILCIKENMADGGDITAAAEAYAEMSRPVISSLFIAPSKGGLFSTEERRRAHDDKEFQELVHQFRTDAGWYQRPENEV